MPIVVDVKSKEDYAKWAGEQKTLLAAAATDPNKVWERGELVGRGAIIYVANCAACHQATGKGVPGAFPALDGSKIVNGPKAAQIAIVLNGKPGTAMPPWTQLSDTDLAAVITYTRNSWSNKTGEAVQPSDIKGARK
jgi:cytochrome c oxidase subunit 2